jgi:hypothetical protein
MFNNKNRGLSKLENLLMKEVSSCVPKSQARRRASFLIREHFMLSDGNINISIMLTYENPEVRALGEQLWHAQFEKEILTL